MGQNIAGDEEKEDNTGDEEEEDLLEPFHEEVRDEILNTSDHTYFEIVLNEKVNDKEEHNKLTADEFDDFIILSNNPEIGNEYENEENLIVILLSHTLTMIILI